MTDTCPHCQATLFYQGLTWEEGIGLVKMLHCDDCNITYRDYSPEQRRKLDEMEMEEDHRRQEACAEAETEPRRFRLYKGIRSENGLTWVEVAAARTEAEADRAMAECVEKGWVQKGTAMSLWTDGRLTRQWEVA